jgi:dienelactone hydrolase
MASSQKPTIVLVPGAWHLGTIHYRDLNERLQQAGYEVVALDLPSTDGEPDFDDWQKDITFISKQIKELADQGKGILLLMHSRGGLCGSDAAEGLSKTDREKAGKKGGIVRCVYMCAFCAVEGQSLWVRTLKSNTPPSF